MAQGLVHATGSKYLGNWFKNWFTHWFTVSVFVTFLNQWVRVMIAGLFNPRIWSVVIAWRVYSPIAMFFAEFTMPVAGAIAIATVLGLCGCFGVAMQPNECKWVRVAAIVLYVGGVLLYPVLIANGLVLAVHALSLVLSVVAFTSNPSGKQRAKTTHMA